MARRKSASVNRSPDRGAGAARQERQRVVLDGAGESRQQAVEGQQDLAGQLVAGRSGASAGSSTAISNDRPVGPRPQVVGAGDAVRRVAALGPAEAAGGQRAAVAQRPVKQIGVLADVVAEAAAGVPGLAADAQAVAQAGRVQPDEELGVAPAAGAARQKAIHKAVL